MSRKLKILALLVILIFSSVSYSESIKGTINLTIKGVKSSKGNIMVALFNNAECFPVCGKELVGKSVQAIGKEVQVKFSDLPFGEYAIAIYHDKNSDMILNRNFFGIPKEPYGFSNSVSGQVPSFKDSKFRLDNKTPLNITVKIGN